MSDYRERIEAVFEQWTSDAYTIETGTDEEVLEVEERVNNDWYVTAVEQIISDAILEDRKSQKLNTDNV